MKTATRYLTAVAAGALASSFAFAGATKPLPLGDYVVETTYTAEFVRSDLETPAGARAAYARLRTLARRACNGADSDFLRIPANFEEQRCVAAALDGAVKQLGSPLVSELHDDRY